MTERTLTAAEIAANHKAMQAALPTMKANGAFLLARLGIENPTTDERRAAELVAMNAHHKHPLFIGMILGCTCHELYVIGGVTKRYFKEGDNRQMDDATYRTLVEGVAKELPIREAA